MKDLVLLILNQIPKYLSNFISVLVGPKSFVRERNDDKQQTIAEAMVFFGISFVISMILSWPLMPTRIDTTQYLATRALLNLILVMVATAVTLAGWRLVGGHATFGRFFVINCYYAGILVVCQTLISICAFGVVKIFDPELYPVMIDSLTQYGNEKLNALVANNRQHFMVVLAFFLIYLIDIAAVFLWSILGWGAFREINGLSRTRSFTAGMIAGVLSAFVMPVLLLIQAVLG